MAKRIGGMTRSQWLAAKAAPRPTARVLVAGPEFNRQARRRIAVELRAQRRRP